MDKLFPSTIFTLMQKIKVPPSETDRQAAWSRFFQLYHSAMIHFVSARGGASIAEDIVQQVAAKLEPVIVNGQYDPSKGAFHSYSATMLCNELHMQHRKDLARREDRKVSLDNQEMPMAVGTTSDGRKVAVGDLEVVPNYERGAETPLTDPAIGEDWEKAVVLAAVARVLEGKSSLKQRHRDIYRAYVLEERPIAEVAEEFGETRNNISQIKLRVEKLIVAEGQKMVAAELALRNGNVL